MFTDLSRSLGVVSGLVLSMILVIFCAAFLVAHQHSNYLPASVPDSVDPMPAMVLTDQQKQGASIFKTNCGSCHKRYKKMTGPALHGVTERREKEWLYTWIYDSSKMIKSGDPQAVALYEEYNQSNMNAFPLLSKEEVDAILSWVEIPK